MPLQVPALDDDRLRTPPGIEPPPVIEAKAAGLDADHRGCRGNPVGLDRKLEPFEAFDVSAAPK
jgi:hypothetical protein